MHGYSGGIRIAIPAKGGFPNLLSGKHLPTSASEDFADLVFGGRERHGRIAHRDLLGTEIHSHGPEKQGMRALALFSSEVRVHLRPQLGSTERLAHVIIGAQPIAYNGIFLRHLGSQKNDRSVEAWSDPPHKIEPVEFGHHYVAQDKIESRKIHIGHAHRFDGAYDIVPIALEHARKRRKDRLLIVNRQYARHRASRLSSFRFRHDTRCF